MLLRRMPRWQVQGSARHAPQSPSSRHRRLPALAPETRNGRRPGSRLSPDPDRSAPGLLGNKVARPDVSRVVLGDEPGQRTRAIRGCVGGASRDSQMALGFRRKAGTPAPRPGRRHCPLGRLEQQRQVALSPQPSSASSLSWATGRGGSAQRWRLQGRRTSPGRWVPGAEQKQVTWGW